MWGADVNHGHGGAEGQGRTVEPPGSGHGSRSWVPVLVEIPRGSRNKYELDQKTGRIFLDRVLYSSVHYPTDYGFIPDTLADDGDPVDALVVTNEPTFPGCIVPARPIGVLDMRDEKGQDHKVLCVPVGDPRFEGVEDLKHLSPHWLREIENFFQTYKTLEEKETEVVGWEDAVAAWAIIEAGRRAFGVPDGSGLSA
jgi:inorganic pyrophosphatase